MPDCVKVVRMLGIGRKVEANDTLLVGHCGEVLVAVMEVGGIGCIGAYFVKPVCSLYGVAQAPSPASEVPAAATVAASATSFTTAGPVVPETVAKAVVTAAEKTPVIPVRVKRLEKVVTVPPAVAVEIIPKKLLSVSSIRSRASYQSYYAFVVEPPVPTGIVTDNELALNVPVDMEYSCCGAVFDPVYRSSWYAERSAIDGASPESSQVTVNAVPPLTLAPAAGTVNSGYAKTAGTNAAKPRRAFEERMAIAFQMSDCAMIRKVNDSREMFMYW